MFGMDAPTLRKSVCHLIIHQRLQMTLDLEKELLKVDIKGTDVKELQQLSRQYVS